MTLVFAALVALAVAVFFTSLRAVHTLEGCGGVLAKPYLSAVRRAHEGGDERALTALAGDGQAFLPRALALALETQRKGGRAELGAREVLIEARLVATRALGALRVAASLASALGLLGAITAYFGARRETQPLALLEAGSIERAALADATLAITLGLSISAYALLAGASLRASARTLLESLRDLSEIVEREGH